MSEWARRAKRVCATVLFFGGAAVAMWFNIEASDDSVVGQRVGIMTGSAFVVLAVAHNFLSPPREPGQRDTLWYLVRFMAAITFAASYLHTLEVLVEAQEPWYLRFLIASIPDGLMFTGASLVEALAPTRPVADTLATEPTAVPAVPTRARVAAVRAGPRAERKPQPGRVGGAKAKALAYLDQHGEVPRSELVAKLEVSDGTAGNALREWRGRHQPGDGGDAVAGASPSLNGQTAGTQHDSAGSRGPLTQ